MSFRRLGQCACAAITSCAFFFANGCTQPSDTVAEVSIKPLYLQAGGGGSGGGGGGGSGAGGGAGGGGAGGSGGAGSPSQTPAAPEPEAGPTLTPELAPSYGPLTGFFAAKDRLKDATGTVPRLGIDLTSQSVVSGPSEFTEMVWRYDFGINQQLWKGAQMDLAVRGGEGDDPARRFGSTMNTNQYADTPNEAFILHLWVEQKLFDDQLTLRVGKLDIGDWVDVNRFGYYNFLGYSNNHNNAIPFPGNPLAGMFTIEPEDTPWLFFSAGIANSEQSSLTGGFHELREGDTALFAIAEVGLKLEIAGQEGIYRFIGWYDGRDLTPIAGGSVDGERTGFAISFDQNLTKNFGLFLRYGFADQSEFTPRHYWQVGFDWKGVFPGRPKDDLALAVTQNIFTEDRGTVVENSSDYETYIEAYYGFVVYDWMQIRPIFQVLANPGGVTDEAAWMMGVHVAFRF